MLSVQHPDQAGKSPSGTLSKIFCVQQIDLSGCVLHQVSGHSNSHLEHGMRWNQLPCGSTTPCGRPWLTQRGKPFSSWVRFFGPPSMVITDSGNEFQGKPERGCESLAILQHVTVPECPWENAKAERHGVCLKGKLDKEIQLRQILFLHLGRARRVPHGHHCDKEPCNGSIGVDSLQPLWSLGPCQGFQVTSCHRSYVPLKMPTGNPLAAMEQNSRAAIHGAARSATHQTKQWAQGQWVYVFRRGRHGQEHVLVSNNRIIYVAMRTRLWRCSPEQLRPAMPAEVLGQEIATNPGVAELVRQVPLDQDRRCGRLSRSSST